jgi:GNAT superfamily N-acetyltransferase
MVLRGARPGDAPAVAAMHGRCSMDTVFRRYLCAGPAVSPAWQARLLTTTVALVAVDDRAAVRAMGNISERSEQEAELAVLVEDAYQGRGLGTTMARHLAAAARLAGYATLRMELLPSSTAAAHVAGALGPSVVQEGQGVLTRTLRLRVETLAGLAAA